MVRALLLALVALAPAGCGGDKETALPQGGDPVDIDPARFTSEIDHPFWPMAPGTTWVYREGDQRVEVTVTDRTRMVMGVEARVVHDLVTEDGEPVGHAGAWEAGVDGALPGILLPADPEVGMTYRQEHYAGEAEDRAKVLSLDEAVQRPVRRLHRRAPDRGHDPV